MSGLCLVLSFTASFALSPHPLHISIITFYRGSTVSITHNIIVLLFFQICRCKEEYLLFTLNISWCHSVSFSCVRSRLRLVSVSVEEKDTVTCRWCGPPLANHCHIWIIVRYSHLGLILAFVLESRHADICHRCPCVSAARANSFMFCR